MNYFIGTDIIEVSRIKKAMEDENFKQKVFTFREISYCENKNKDTKYQNYAARFAGKEAVFKAISKLLENKYEVSWLNIEIVNDKSGRPQVNLIDTNIENIKIDISLSHIKEYATATAIAFMQ